MAVLLAKRVKKWGPCLGTRAPSGRVSIVSVVFTPTRGVIHPSFPLRGRWERTLKRDEQAPSPSLATFLDSSLETRTRSGTLHELRQPDYSKAANKVFTLFYLTCARMSAFAPNRSREFTLELCHQGAANRHRRNSSAAPNPFQDSSLSGS